MLESKIQKDIINYLKKKRIYHFRFQAQSNLNGLPDILALYKGIFLGLELKKDDGEPTGLQLKKIASINENGGIGVILKSVKEIELLINLIDSYDDEDYGKIKPEILLGLFDNIMRVYENDKQVKK